MLLIIRRSARFPIPNPFDRGIHFLDCCGRPQCAAKPKAGGNKQTGVKSTRLQVLGQCGRYFFGKETTNAQ